jgi:hypothetical protein
LPNPTGSLHRPLVSADPKIACWLTQVAEASRVVVDVDRRSEELGPTTAITGGDGSLQGPTWMKSRSRSRR